MSPDTGVYHGTRRPFGKGGYLMPRAFHGDPGTSAPLNPGAAQPADADQWVYVTTSLTLAWVYAWCAPGRVLTVQPVGEVTRDPEHSVAMEAYRCEVAKVVAVSHDPVISEEEARSGWASTHP